MRAQPTNGDEAQEYKNDPFFNPGFIHKLIEMDKTRCNFELGNQRHVKATEWKDEIRIDVREYEIQNVLRIHTNKEISPPSPQMEDVG